MTESPRPPSLKRNQSSVSETRSNSNPLQSAQSSLSSFTAYFGASTVAGDDETKASIRNSQQGSEINSLAHLIPRAFAPSVPVVASADVNDLAKRKGYASFFDLLRPFGDMVGSKVVYKDSNGLAAPLENFNVNFVELGPASNMINYGQVDIQRPGLVPVSDLYAPGGDLVALERQIENEMQVAGENLASTEKSNTAKSLPDATTYYESFFQSLLSGLPTSSHETFSHPVAMCIAVSSQNQFPIATLASLSDRSKKSLPSWIDPDFLFYYILVHDEDQDDLVTSNIIYDEMRVKYGTPCYLLRLNSSKTNQEMQNAVEVPLFDRRSAPERLRSRWHGPGRTSSFLPSAVLAAENDLNKLRYLSPPDHTGLVSLVREMVIRSIVPHMERSITLWNEEVAGPRRGIAGRLFKVGRSLWGSSSRTATPVSGNGNYDPQTSSYRPDTPEAQLRKLADYAFMLRDWKLANGVYDMLRKDFSNDRAWKHHAGAQEMYVVSLLLQSPTISEKVRTETIAPTLDSALYNYLSRSTAPYSALRSMVVTSELLRVKGGGAVDDAAKWIMRIMAEKLVGEMTRALLVDRVGYCFATGEAHNSETETETAKVSAAVNYKGSRRRKAAFWRALAAESWSSIGKHRLARQALQAALRIYGDNQWIAIQGTLSTLKYDTGLTASYKLTPSPRVEKADPMLEQTNHSADTDMNSELSRGDKAKVQSIDQTPVATALNTIELPGKPLDDEVPAIGDTNHYIEPNAQDPKQSSNSEHPTSHIATTPHQDHAPTTHEGLDSSSKGTLATTNAITAVPDSEAIKEPNEEEPQAEAQTSAEQEPEPNNDQDLDLDAIDALPSAIINKDPSTEEHENEDDVTSSTLTKPIIDMSSSL